jgi:hypothetical protein
MVGPANHVGKARGAIAADESGRRLSIDVYRNLGSHVWRNYEMGLR